MARRPIRTTNLLAVALGAAAAGCTATPAPTPEPPMAVERAPSAAQPNARPAGALATPAVTAPPEQEAGEPATTEVVPVASESRPASAGADAPSRSELMRLRDELSQVGRAGARGQPDKFRPLCDEAGYPLVGNVVRKAPNEYLPSQLCADLRKER